MENPKNYMKKSMRVIRVITLDDGSKSYVLATDVDGDGIDNISDPDVDGDGLYGIYDDESDSRKSTTEAISDGLPILDNNILL